MGNNKTVNTILISVISCAAIVGFTIGIVLFVKNNSELSKKEEVRNKTISYNLLEIANTLNDSSSPKAEKILTFNYEDTLPMRGKCSYTYFDKDETPYIFSFSFAKAYQNYGVNEILYDLSNGLDETFNVKKVDYIPLTKTKETEISLLDRQYTIKANYSYYDDKNALYSSMILYSKTTPDLVCFTGANVDTETKVIDLEVTKHNKAIIDKDFYYYSYLRFIY